MPNEMQVMTSEEAWEYADYCVSTVSMGRPAHIKGIQAMTILKQLIPSGNGNGSVEGLKAGKAENVGAALVGGTIDGTDNQKETEK